MDIPSVCVVLVNWHTARDTIECVESLRASDYPNLRTIVVENGSTDNSLELIRRSVPSVTLIDTGANLGFTGGNNAGIKTALVAGADYVMLLNNDTVVAPNLISQLVATAQSDESIGIVTGKILQYGRPTVWSAGTSLDRRFLTVRLQGYGLPDVNLEHAPRDVPWITGCAMLIRRAVLDRVGFLDDALYLSAEDLDYSLKVVGAGYRLVYDPRAILWHKESVSAGGNDAPRYVYYQTRNLLLVHNRWAVNWAHLLATRLYSFLYFAKRFTSFLARRRFRSIAGLAYGIRDGLRGTVGAREYALLSVKKN
jgi:GT2 family glycosyltransferase